MKIAHFKAPWAAFLAVAAVALGVALIASVDVTKAGVAWDVMAAIVGALMAVAVAAANIKAYRACVVMVLGCFLLVFMAFFAFDVTEFKDLAYKAVLGVLFAQFVLILRALLDHREADE